MRLPVILVQNPPAAGASLAEALVGNLIGRAGLDLTLVNRFDALAPESTDRMTLDAITVPSAVLDWRSPEEMLAVLTAIEFHGFRCPHRLDSGDPTAVPHSNRRLFLFDLTRHHDAMTIVAELDRLRDSLSVKTVSLGAIGTKSSPVSRPEAKAFSPNVVKAPPAPLPETDPQRTTSTGGILRSDQSLDDLIDQLDGQDV
jgi:hypothetical protein